MSEDKWVSGAWKVQCDRCGFHYLSYQLAVEWQGLRTCRGPGTNECWEPRHPQDFVTGKKDDQTVPWRRPNNDQTVYGVILDAKSDPIRDAKSFPVYDAGSGNVDIG